MNRRLLGSALLGAILLFTTTSAYGFGGKRAAHSATTTGGCGSPCEMPYAPVTISYVEQKVMVNEWKTVKEEYKYWVMEPETKKQKVTVKEMKTKEEPYKYIANEWKSSKEKVMVKEMKTKEEPYKYIANEWKSSKEKVMVKEMKTKEEPYKYITNEWKSSKEKVKVAECQPVVKEVEFTTYSCTPVVTKQLRTVCDWVSVPVTVTAPVPPPAGHTGLFGRLCAKKTSHGAPIDTCGSPCETPVMTYTVMKRQMVTRQIEVDVVAYQRVPQTVKRPVTTYTTVWVEKEVMVTKCVPVEKMGTKLVPVWIDVEKEVEVKKCVPVEKMGTKLVPVWIDVEKEVEVTTWKKIEKVGVHDVQKCTPVEKMVKVAVYTPVAGVAAPSSLYVATPSMTTGGCGSRHGKLFKGGLFSGMGCCK